MQERLIVAADAAATSRLGRDGWRVEPLLDGADGVWLATRDDEVPSAGDAFDLARRVAAADGVAAAEPDLPVPAPARPLPAAGDPAGDPDRDWPHRLVRLDAAWEHADGSGVRVGHPDTGYTHHPDVDGDMWDLDGAWDVLAGDGDPRDELVAFGTLLHPSHGTSTGALIAGRHPAAPPGAAPGARLVPFRCVLSVVQVLDSDVARAVDRAVAAGCRVVSMSLGGLGFVGLRAAVRRAVDAGAVVVAAAGNSITWVCPPAAYPESVAVAGVDRDGRAWSGSGRGAEVDVAGPAADVTTVGWNTATEPPTAIVGTWSGTSFASALTAGVAALWLAHHDPERLSDRYGGRVADAFRTAATATARRPAGWPDGWGAGILDAGALLDAPLPDPDHLAAGAPWSGGARLARAATPDPLAAMEDRYRELAAGPGPGPGGA